MNGMMAGAPSSLGMLASTAAYRQISWYAAWAAFIVSGAVSISVLLVVRRRIRARTCVVRRMPKSWWAKAIPRFVTKAAIASISMPEKPVGLVTPQAPIAIKDSAFRPEWRTTWKKVLWL